MELKYKSLLFIGLLLPMLAIPRAEMQAEVTDVMFTTGYRRDKGSSTLNLVNSKGKNVGRQTFKVNGISIYQLGGKATAAVAGCAGRASIDYGWVHNGKFDETLVINDAQSFARQGGIRKGTTRDVDVAVAWFWMNNSLCQFGPSGGYAKSQQNFVVRGAKNKAAAEEEIHLQKYKNKWQGPFVGGDAYLQMGDFIFKAAYEYHWAHWKGSSKLAHEGAAEVISGKGESKHARGRVYFVEGGWNFCQCYTIGCSVKWQQWSAPVGKISKLQRLASLIRPAKKKAKAIRWESFIATIDLGYAF
jgi:hypothetical protein